MSYNQIKNPMKKHLFKLWQLRKIKRIINQGQGAAVRKKNITIIIIPIKRMIKKKDIHIIIEWEIMA